MYNYEYNGLTQCASGCIIMTMHSIYGFLMRHNYDVCMLLQLAIALH